MFRALVAKVDVSKDNLYGRRSKHLPLGPY
jgi:hypothetical protein